MNDTSVDDVVRRLSRRPGYRLVTYREVAIPFWDVPIRCRVLAKKALPALDEFTLRCVDAGLHTSDDVSSFLGIPTTVVDVVMGKLLVAGCIVPRMSSIDPPDVRYTVSGHGKSVLRDLSDVTIQDRTIPVAYDGLRGVYQMVDASLRWRPRDLRDEDVLEIPAFPADPPNVYPRDTAAVAEALEDVTHRANIELVTVVGVDGKRSRFFVRGLALVFESVDNASEVHVHFAIDGRPSEEHDRAFVKAEGQRKLGILESLQRSTSVAESVLDDEVLKLRVDEREISTLRRTSELLKAQLESLENSSKASENSDGQDELLTDEVAEVARKLDQAQAALDRIPVRILEVHEHPPILEDALQTSRSRLMIVSPWIRAAVVNDKFVERIRSLLDGGVKVSIGYGIDDGKQTFDRDVAAERKLSTLAADYQNFDFVRLGDTHAKVLIVDDRYVVITSFNWLSFRGHPDRPFRDERGTLVSIDVEINRLYNHYLDRMNVESGTEIVGG